MSTIVQNAKPHVLKLIKREDGTVDYVFGMDVMLFKGTLGVSFGFTYFIDLFSPMGECFSGYPDCPSVPAKSDNHDNGTTGFHTIRRIYRVGLDPAFRLYAAGFDWCRTRTIHLGDDAGRVCWIGIHHQETTATLQLSALV